MKFAGRDDVTPPTLILLPRVLVSEGSDLCVDCPVISELGELVFEELVRVRGTRARRVHPWRAGSVPTPAAGPAGSFLKWSSAIR